MRHYFRFDLGHFFDNAEFGGVSGRDDFSYWFQPSGASGPVESEEAQIGKNQYAVTIQFGAEENRGLPDGAHDQLPQVG